MFDLHLDFIKKYPDIFIEPQELPDAEVVWYAFPIILQENQRFTRTEMQKYLEMHNIQTRPVFAGNIARQPGFKSDKIKIVGGLENADYIMTNALVIGCHQGMDDTHTNWVHEILEKFISLN